MEKLASYLAQRGITQNQFAKEIDTDTSVVSRFVNGLARPGIDLAVKIERITKKAVPVEAWLRDESSAAK